MTNSSQPLVSILIPTYNRPDYFIQALKSALNQTYKNIEIIVADDSTNDETEKAIQSFLTEFPLIRYIKNPHNLGQFENDLMLLELANGDYVNFLMDDDLFHPQKLERMVPYLMADRSIKLVTSHRQGIDSNSNLLPLRDVTLKVISQDSIFDGTNMVKLIFANKYNLTNFNFVGEPTTVLFRKNDLVEKFGFFAGRKYESNVDLATWFSLMIDGKGVYLADTLSYFRIHEGRQINSFDMNIKNVTDHAHSLIVIRNYFEMDNNDFGIAIERYFNQLFSFGILNKKRGINSDAKISLRILEELQEFSIKLLDYQKNLIEGIYQELVDGTYRYAEKPIAPDHEKWTGLIKNRDNQISINASIDVIIPVYRGYDETLACLYSVLSSPQKTKYEIVVINDKSPNDSLTQELLRLQEYGLITLIENKENRGFVYSVNLGMKLHQDRDVILLNSDTIVYGDWLDRMKYAAENENVATVTPLSTNATVCSYPFINNDNPMELEIGYDVIDRICARENIGGLVEAPSGVGFCMYIRRSVINNVGLFDEDAFGRGYGEENDFCLKASKMGWRNVIAPNIFVRHLGETSFLGERKRVLDRALKIILERYPDYQDKVDSFVNMDPLKKYRVNIDLARLTKRTVDPTVPVFLIITGNPDDRIEKRNMEIANNFETKGINVVFLKPNSVNQNMAQLYHPVIRFIPNIDQFSCMQPERFYDTLKSIGISEIHIHQFSGYSEEWLNIIMKAKQILNIDRDFIIHR